MTCNNRLTEANIKNRTSYYFDDMINDLDYKDIKVDKIMRDVLIYCIGYET